MNRSADFQTEEIASACEFVTFLGGTLNEGTTEAYTVIVYLIIINLICLPITSISNALVIFAVKTKTTPENHEQHCPRLLGDNRLCDGGDWTALFHRRTGSIATGRRIKCVLPAFSNVNKRCQSVRHGFNSSLNTYEHGKIHCYNALAKVHNISHHKTFTLLLRFRVVCFFHCPITSPFSRKGYLLKNYQFDVRLMYGHHTLLSNCDFPGN